jgi:hypothetical protein
MYIVLLALRSQRRYTQEVFVDTMTEVLIPVTMTSLVNAAMFAVMNLVDVPAVYLTAQVALISVIFLYFTVITCFPAYCYLDMKRQAAGRYDVVVCLKRSADEAETEEDHEPRESLLYSRVYKQLVLGKGALTMIVRGIVVVGVAALIGVGSYGITQREVGLGLQVSFCWCNVWRT